MKGASYSFEGERLRRLGYDDPDSIDLSLVRAAPTGRRHHPRLGPVDLESVDGALALVRCASGDVIVVRREHLQEHL